MKSMPRLELSDARRIAAHAIGHAEEIGVAVSVIIVNECGFPVYLERLDGAAFQTPDVARGKALTSVMMRKPSKDIEDAALARPTLAQFSDGRLPIQGGVPLFSGEYCLGAVGVSGGTPEQDEAIAYAGAASL
ncbi:GlcG/HbpS family heme-binding protein [Burkholderia gladioli]|uniref:GlcG/HbpS family heme-binding protein n=1 Tax=Burkholderia gladioli TaxID=28095 RepID=UPI00163F58DF|nr:heme-binding protein [Burkholderia gladioli]